MMSEKRVHVVLVPGFAGFDALGQLEYYAGITPLFRQWQNRRKARPVVLHYFDNFPTAAVSTRAARLRSYLAKRVARGEFSRGDTVALVGHSTGGLDIRRLLSELSQADEPIPVDGGSGVEPSAILAMVNRVVFLSVPQWGTNIADWLTTHDLIHTVVIAELRAMVEASQVPLVDRLQDSLAGAAAWLTDSDLMLAAQDALNEADPRSCPHDPLRTALAQEAASELALWLRHMASDFSAIEDLAPHRRALETDTFDTHHIQTRSYATLGRPPFRFDPGQEAPRLDLLKPWTYPEITKDRELSQGTGLLYRACYRACAGGPFAYPDDSGFEPVATELSSGKRRHIEIWDNDGIVNTASMLWPNGPETRLVEGDHADIIGHYRRVEAIEGRGRRYQAYDLLKSGTDFRATFEQVWNGVFDFCL